MKSAEQVRWDFVQQWRGNAEQDLAAARVLFHGGTERYESVGFHAQQAAEKFVKAFLVRHQVEFPKTPDLGRLRRLVAQADVVLASRLSFADVLSSYGVEGRGTGGLEVVSHDQGGEALGLAEEVRSVILENLKPYLDGGRPEAEARA